MGLPRAGSFQPSTPARAPQQACAACAQTTQGPIQPGLRHAGASQSRRLHANLRLAIRRRRRLMRGLAPRHCSRRCAGLRASCCQHTSNESSAMCLLRQLRGCAGVQLQRRQAQCRCSAAASAACRAAGFQALPATSRMHCCYIVRSFQCLLGPSARAGPARSLQTHCPATVCSPATAPGPPIMAAVGKIGTLHELVEVRRRGQQRSGRAPGAGAAAAAHARYSTAPHAALPAGCPHACPRLTRRPLACSWDAGHARRVCRGAPCGRD